MKVTVGAAGGTVGGVGAKAAALWFRRNFVFFGRVGGSGGGGGGGTAEFLELEPPPDDDDDELPPCR